MPQQTAFIVERLGKFHAVLEPGLHFLVPLADSIAYVHSLKEEAISVSSQQAITKDNVSIVIDGVLYAKIDDPYKASYGVENVRYALMQLAQTTMRSELGKISLDKTFEERETLNVNIVQSINNAAASWGIQCLRYEIRDIAPAPAVRAAMDLQAEAERRKRAEILRSEGEREAVANAAEGARRAVVTKAQGEAEAIVLRARANSEGIGMLRKAIGAEGGSDAVALRLAEQYIMEFGKLAKKSNTLMLPSNAGDIGGMVAQAMAVYGQVQASTATGRGAGAAAAEEEFEEGEGEEEVEEEGQGAEEAAAPSAKPQAQEFVPRPF